MKNNQQAYLAHVRVSSNGQWDEHTLDEHLRAVAKLAEKFAEPFSSADWAANASAIALGSPTKTKAKPLLNRIPALKLDYCPSPIQQQGAISGN